MKFWQIFSLFFLSLITICAAAQNNKTDTASIHTLYNSFLHSNKKQSVLLNTDRKIYLAGEKIWFSAFVVNAFTNKVDRTANNLFADIVNDEDSVIEKLILNNHLLKNAGAFSLPDSLPTGFYWLRCYTSKMLQQPNDISIMPVYVLNKNLHDEYSYNKTYQRNNSKNKATEFIQFYPERFTAFPNMLSTGVIKITDFFHNPLQTKGSITDNKDSVVCSFATNRYGLARVTFLAIDSSRYTATANINGENKKYVLPPVQKNAIQLSVAKQTNTSITVIVSTEEGVPANTKTTIMAIHSDSLCYASVGTGTYGINVPLTNFPGGVTTLFLFNANQELIAERDIYIHKNNYQFTAETNKKNYAARDSVAITATLIDVNQKPLPALLNISVQDGWLQDISDSLEVNNVPLNNKSMFNNWLAQNSSALSMQDIDLLLTSRVLTKPSEERNDALTEYDDSARLLNIYGKLINSKAIPVRDRFITTVSKSNAGFFFHADTSKADGSFIIPVPQDISSDISFSLQVQDKHRVTRLNDKMIIDSFQFPVLRTPPALKQQYINNNLNTLATVQKHHIDTAAIFQGKGWLKPVIVKTVQKKQLNYDESRRMSNMSEIITRDKFRNNSYGAVTSALLSTPGISISFGDLSIQGPYINFHGIVRPLVLLDGVPLSSDTSGGLLDYFNTINAADIDFIEVLKGADAALYGSRGAAGVILINSYRGVDYSSNNITNFHFLIPVTYHTAPQFIMPDYANTQIKHNNTPDPRTTIYWQPLQHTNSGGSINASFYTADDTTPYAVTFSGITPNGDVIYKRIFINKN